MLLLKVFINLLHSYCEIIIFMFFSVLESDVPKEKAKPATFKKGFVLLILIENYVHVNFFIFFVNNVDP